MTDIQLKCPGCGAPINFDASSGMMKCQFCDSTFTVAQVNEFNGISAANEKLEATRQGAGKDDKGQADEEGWRELPPTYLDEKTGETMAQFMCNSCGGEIVGSPDLVSSKCPWCDNNFVAVGQLTRTRVPDRMIPFAMTHEQALAAFKNNMKGLWFIPKPFRSVRVTEVKGVYVPYWLYDASVFGEAWFSGELTRTECDIAEEVTYHDIYDIYRAGNIAYLDVPVSGSSKIKPEITEAIEPFDYSASQSFSPAYLTGFMTDKYDIEAENASGRALKRMKESADEFLANSVQGFTSVTPKGSNISPAFGQLEYVFLPVWLVNVMWGGKLYSFAMNGQTGKFIGNFPIDNKKYWGMFTGSAILSTLLTAGVLIKFLLPWSNYIIPWAIF